MFDDLIPETLEDTILTYLKGQEAFAEGYSDQAFELGHTTREDIKDVLEELLLRVNKRIACRDRYENLKLWHHQYPLFDLNTFVPNFCIDDEMLQKLAFRENLLISEIDSESGLKEAEPSAVGGLCLNVQAVDGHQPEKREIPSEAEMDRQVFLMLQKIKSVSENKPLQKSPPQSVLEKEIQKKLEQYEKFLKAEMSNNVKKFIVHFSSQFDVDGCNAGSNITSWVDRYFHTLEEKREEFIVQPSGINEKTIYTAIQNHKYYMRHTSTIDDLDVRKYYPFPVTKDLVLEGANFLLMRYLAITKFIGTFELSTMYINGDMCRNIYECIGPQKGEVNGKTIDVCKIYRYVIEESGIEHHSVTVLTSFGRIITQEWEACNYILNMNPLQYVDNKEPSTYDRQLLTKTWQKDMQLMSKYLDFKTIAERQMKTYMVDHPEVKEIISDYVQNVLLLKPENIMTFTLDYFQNLYPCNTPRIPYLEGNNNERKD